MSERYVIQVRRVYDPPQEGEGYRVLVDRLWPRGLSKEAAAIDAWQRDLAPTEELRRWFGHSPARWEEFRARYRAELSAPERQMTLQEMARRAKEEPITFLYAARDKEHNNALVLREALEELLGL